MAEHPLRVVVVGAGIGGLAAAHSLLQRGHNVRVFEQAARLGEIGAGVQIAPNALRILERLGLRDAVEHVGVRLRSGSAYYRSDGTPVTEPVLSDSSGSYGVYGVHRADLLQVLAASLPADTIVTGSRCVAFSQDAVRARVEFADGRIAEADLVVAADGIHSVLRAEVTPPSHPVPSGSEAYRGLIPATHLPAWPPGLWEMWMGEGKHFLVFPVRGGELINYVGFVPSVEPAEESWSAPGDPAQLAAEFASWDPRISELLAQVTTTFRWGLYDREPVEAWSAGRLTLLGDAAHPMLPHLGQGANQSIEDAAALAEILAGVSSDGVPAALVAYQDLRRERTALVQQGARANALRYDSAYDDLDTRDSELASARGFRLWIYDHDAEAMARHAGRT